MIDFPITDLFDDDECLTWRNKGKVYARQTTAQLSHELRPDCACV
jgi:hypothetical protein